MAFALHTASVTSDTHTGSGVTSTTLTIGTAGLIALGDIVVITATITGGTTVSSVGGTYAGGTGWTISNSPSSIINSNTTISAFIYRTNAPANALNDTIIINFSGGSDYSVQCSSFTGSGAVDITPQWQSNASGTYTTQSITTTAPNEMVLASFATSSGVHSTFTSGFTLVSDSSTGTGVGSADSALFSYSQASAGAIQATLTPSAANANITGILSFRNAVTLGTANLGTATATAASSATITTTNTITAGQALILAVGCHSNQTLSSVTGTFTGTWTIVNSSTTPNLAIAYCLNAPARASGVTVIPNMSASGGFSAVLSSFNNVGTAVDNSTSFKANASGTNTTNSITPGTNDDLIIAAQALAATGLTYTYTNVSALNLASNGGSVSTKAQVVTAYAIQTTAAAITATLTPSTATANETGIVSFLVAVAPNAPPFRQIGRWSGPS